MTQVVKLIDPLQDCIEAIISELAGEWTIITHSEINGDIINNDGVILYFGLEDIQMLRVHITKTSSYNFPSFRAKASKYNAKVIAKKCQKLINQYAK